MLENISSKNGKALLGIAFSFLLSNATLGAAGTRVRWTSEQDNLLENGVRIHGAKKKWRAVAALVPGRTAKQCRERWSERLDPDVNNEQWTEEEDQILIDAHGILGGQWEKIARRLRGRTNKHCRRRLVFLTVHRLKVSYRRARILLAHSPKNLFTRLQAASHRLLPEVAADSDPDAVDGEDDQQAEALHYPAPEMEEDEDESEMEEDGYGTPAAADGAAATANPPPPPASSHVPALGLAEDGHGAAATGTVFPANLQQSPLRSHLLGANRDGTPGAVAGEDAPCHLEFQRFVQCSIPPSRQIVNERIQSF